MADAYAFIHETLSVPRRDASDIVTDELLHLIELLSSSTPASLDDSSGQQINTQRLFPLHSQTLMNVSSACRNDSLALIEAFLQRQYWAITVADANFKLPTGVLQGDLKWLGSYSECLNVTVPITRHHQEGLFKTHYCSATIGGSQNPLPGRTVSMGLCVPRTCSEEDMQHMLNAALSTVSVETVTVSCLPKSTHLSASAVVLIVFLGCLGAALLAGTLYDIIIYQSRIASASSSLMVDGVVDGTLAPPGLDNRTSEGTPLLEGQGKKTGTRGGESRLVRTALALSLYSNGAKVVDTSTTKEGTLGAIHGIRFISMSWVMLGHVYVFGSMYFKNPIVILSYLKRFTFQAIWNATVSVDSFFVMSGTLVSYLLLREMKRKGGPWKVNWLHFYLHRYWRLTPPYMLVMAVWAVVFPSMATGPLWTLSEAMGKRCDTWWRNMLYINNLFSSAQDCMGWMWYVANDMQFYILSPLFLVPLFWSRVVGVAIIMVVIVVSMIINGILSYEHEFVAANAFIDGTNINITQLTEFFDVIYQTPWCRVGPYLVGVLVGYLLYITKGQVRMPWFAVGLWGWTVATVGNVSVVYGLYNMMNGHPVSVGVSAFYNAVSRTVWAIGVAWVIFACVTGHGGFVNKLLSWPALVPLSRMTYMTYLVHPIVYVFFFGTRQQLMMLDDTILVVMFLGLLVLSYGVAFLLTITIESPMMALEKVFLPRLSARGHKPDDTGTDGTTGDTRDNVNC
ncbi:hypothetical protein NP493_758g01001 [Ridgeia piscesae]|uniref:Nose resistant-to-fluoxetine protein N-terminal domain-containing protein n=1 Tax=Ridgeia piscesae TaxID=27915 RepID=A0AAD9NPV9_RIDPI|nr:hypothetical protein NP493_758g01001 [Ridgeia piscesae]